MKPRAESYSELKRNLQHTLHLLSKHSRRPEKTAELQLEIQLLEALATVQRRRVAAANPDD